MTYLFNQLKPKAKAHLWDGSDTACRLWSTGGIKQTRPGWITTPSIGGRELCHMCGMNAQLGFQERPPEPMD